MSLLRMLTTGALLLLSLTMVFSPAAAQEQDNVDVAWLLAQINCLRESVGSPPLALNAALTISANRQSHNLSNDNLTNFHVGLDGSTPTTRAQDAGFTGSVGENVASGRAVSDAFTWWIHSPIHYENMTNAHWKDIGIGVGHGPQGTWYTLDFGAMTWAVTGPVSTLPCGTFDTPVPDPNEALQSGASNTITIENTVLPPTPLVIGLDEHGYIQHAIQPGETPGTIILSYGYTWDDLPALMELNHMTEAEARRLNVGDIFLVPPREGLVTPTPIEENDATPMLIAASGITPTPLEESDIILVVSDTPSAVMSPTIPPSATFTPTDVPTLTASPTLTLAPTILTVTPLTEMLVPPAEFSATAIPLNTLVPPVAFVASLVPTLAPTEISAPQLAVTVFPAASAIPAAPAPVTQAASSDKLSMLLMVVIVLQVIIVALFAVNMIRRRRSPAKGRKNNTR